MSVKNYSMNNNKGFSLIELAIVLLIISILIGSFVGTLGTRIENTYRSDTFDQLNKIRDAVLGFAISNGRIPCPAIATSGGQESPVGGGNCNEQHGFVPGGTLGLRGSYNRDSLLLDSWGNPIRYSVTAANANAFTTIGGMKAITMAALTPNLVICDSDTADDTDIVCIPDTKVTGIVPFVIISLGKDGDSFTGVAKADSDQQENSGEVLAAKNAAGEDIEYLVGNDIVFVSKTYNRIEATYFDDLIVWESPYVLYSKMIEAGQLP